jgi:zinc protease
MDSGVAGDTLLVPPSPPMASQRWLALSPSKQPFMTSFIRLLRTAGLLGLLVLLLSPVVAQRDGTRKQRPLRVQERPVPFDPDTRTGTLPNGMRYYVRYNAKPDNYAELRLALNAGSLQETEAQRGLAHFIEHMCFNGTAHFPKSDLLDYLESIGTKFGAHLNAYTSFDETVYMLRVPTDNTEQFQQGFQIIEDWAHEVSMDSEEIDKERGVVIEEWRTRLGASNRISQQTYPSIYYGSRYPDRLPIGDTGVLRTFDYETLRSFYRDWYRPDLMAIVAVGDFDVEAVEAQIKAQFGAIPSPEGDVPARTVYAVPDHAETLIALAEDDEATYNQVQLIYKHPHLPVETRSDYRRMLTQSLASSLIDARLSELMQASDPPFNYVASGYSSLARSKDDYSAFAIVPNGGYLKGLETILTENARAIQHGFTATELARIKQSMMTSMQQQYAERDKLESRRLVMSYVYHFLENSPVPGIENQLVLYEQMLPGISLEDVNTMFRGFIRDSSRVVVLSGAKRDNNPLPSEQEVRALLAKVAKMTLDPYEDNVAAGPLMTKPPKPVSVASRDSIPAIGVTELTYPNGLKVILKPTDFQNNEVLMSAYSPGGTSLYPDEAYMSATRAAGIIRESGLADFDNIQLEKYLSDKVIRLSPYIGELEEGMQGSCAANDLEFFLQMVHLNFTQPRKDEQAFTSIMTKSKANYANLLSNPNLWFRDQVNSVLNQDHFRRDFIESPEKLDQIELETAYRVFRERFGNAGDFTFIFVGSFDPAQMEQLLNLYLGSLPGEPKAETWQDVEARELSEAVEKVYYRGKEPQSQVLMQYHLESEWDTQSRFQLNMAVKVLSIMMRESMREEQGGVYGVRANATAQRYPIGAYTVGISFTCAPENADPLIETVLREVEALQQDGPSAQNMQKVKETLRKEYQVSLTENGFWLGNLSFAYENDLDPARILQVIEKVDALTPEEVQAAAQRFLQEAHLARFVLKPEPAQPDR